MSEVRERLIECFQTVFPELPAGEIPSASLEAVEGWDSVATINLLSVVEETLGVYFTPDDLPGLTSFERILAHVEKQKG